MYRKSGSGVVTENKTFVGFEITTGQSGITSLKPKLPFRAVDSNEAVLRSSLVDANSYISGLGMPSNKYIDLTLGASGSEYTAPANGWYYLSRTSTGASQYIALTSQVATNKLSTGSGQLLQDYVPVLKGCTVRVTYSAQTTGVFRFYYAEGEV